MTPRPVLVTLTEDQRRDAWNAARETRDYHRNGINPRPFTRNQLLTDMRAYAAEIAVSVVRGVPWRGANPATRNNGDLSDGTEVRTTEWPRGRLLISSRDNEQRAYVLVTGRPPTLTVRGWMRGREAKRSQWWWPDAPYMPCWAVPQCALFDIANLVTVIGGVLL